MHANGALFAAPKVISNTAATLPEAGSRRASTCAGTRAAAVYPAEHGWCVPDMPNDGGAPIYSQPEAERAWGKLLELYKSSLA